MIGNTMTASRRERKLRWRQNGRPRTGPVFAAVVWGLGWAGPIGAATTERIVADRHSGLAISGFDPVAYFTDATALPGKGEFEQAVAGVVWRFRSVGNRSAFTADPDVYMPRFGGYDAVGVARGVAVVGNPQLWLIRDERLYLFYSEATRAEFVRDAERIVSTSERGWKVVQVKLVP
jgi:hypothetical protein